MDMAFGLNRLSAHGCGTGAGLCAAAYCRGDVITALDDSHEKVGRQRQRQTSFFSPSLWHLSK